MNDKMKQPQYTSNKNHEQKRKQKKWAIRILILIVLILILLLILFRCGVFSTRDDSQVAIGAGVQEGTPGKSDDGEEGSNGTEQFTIELNAYPTFENGKSEGNLNIVNPEANLLSIEVEVKLNNTGEVIYQSGVIPPGHFVGNDKLAKVLKKGEYEATAAVIPFDPKNPDQQLNRANFDLLLIINN